MKKATTPTCCLTLPLITEKWQSDKLNKRFEIARQIYNSLLGHELSIYHELQKSDEYAEVQSQIDSILKQDQELRDSAALKKLFQERGVLLKNAGLTEYGMMNEMKNFYKHFNDNIGSSVAVHCIASQVWTAFDKLFYGDGKKVRFKRRGDIRSLKGGAITGKSGGTEIMFKGTYIEWKGLVLRIKLDPDNAYESDMLQRHVKYCRIVKEPGKNKDHWYVQLMLEGIPAVKYDPETGEVLHSTGRGNVGIVVGTQLIACVSENDITIREMADKVQDIEKQKAAIQRKMDRSRRTLNPNNYNENGTIKKGAHKWIKSKRYILLQKELAYVQHQQADVRKRQHTEMANEIIAMGDRFITKDIQWGEYARKKTETTVNEKTGQPKSKKSYGKVIANKAPAMLTGIINQKLVSRGLAGIHKVPTDVKINQFNHITGEYTKDDPKVKWLVMPDGKRIYKRIYQAFLLQHVKEDDSLDIEGLARDYDKFLTMHDELMCRLQAEGKKYPGFDPKEWSEPTVQGQSA